MQITLGTTYYNNPENLIQYINHHIDYVDHIIVVDDGSTDPASKYLQKDSKISLYRVLKDYGFNSHGCRNLIMRQTTTDWNILMDVDRLFIDPQFAIELIKKKKLNKNTLYLFEMIVKHADSIHESVNDFMVHKEHFWSVGGYDEELIGIRNGDRHFRMQLENFGNERVITGVQARFTRSPSTSLGKASPNDIHGMTTKLYQMLANRVTCPEPNKPTLIFEWEKVF